MADLAQCGVAGYKETRWGEREGEQRGSVRGGQGGAVQVMVYGYAGNGRQH